MMRQVRQVIIGKKVRWTRWRLVVKPSDVMTLSIVGFTERVAERGEVGVEITEMRCIYMLTR